MFRGKRKCLTNTASMVGWTHDGKEEPMKKAELKKRMNSISCKVFEARVEAESLLEELTEDQGRIRDDDVDTLDHFISDCESAEDTARSI